MSYPQSGHSGSEFSALNKNNFANGNDSQLRAVVRALGAPVHQFPTSPDVNLARTNLTLQQMMENNPQFLTATLSAGMRSANGSIFQIAPMLLAQSDTFWTEHFEIVHEIAPEVPAQAPPDELRFKESKTFARLTRHALAVTATAQELRHQRGLFFFIGKLAYLTIAFIEAVELKFFMALVSVHSEFALAAFQRLAWDIDIQRVGRVDDSMWDILRQPNGGFPVLANKVKQDFSRKSLNVTHAMIREGMRMVEADRDERKIYNLHGPGASQNAEMLADSIGTELAGIQLLTIRGYDYNEKELHLQPLDRRAVIGQHFRIDPLFFPGCDLKGWCSDFLKIEVYSVEDDAWQPITAEQALKASGRFGPEGRLHPHHRKLIEQYNKKLKSAPNLAGTPIDMFIYETEAVDGAYRLLNQTAVFGHMEPWALPDKAVDQAAETLVHFIEHRLVKEERDAIRIGLADINRLYAMPLTVADLASVRGRAIGVFGAPVLEPNRDGVRNYKPRGYGSIAGYFEIAETEGQPEYAWIDQTLVSNAVKFRDAAAKLHLSMLELFGRNTHPALNPAFAPDTLRANGAKTKQTDDINSALNFLQNILDQNKAVLYISNGNANQAPGPGGPAEPAIFESVKFPLVRALYQQTRSPEVAAVFADNDTITAFSGRFGRSRWGKAYRAFVSSGLAPQSAGENVEEAVGGTQATFERFYEQEITTRQARDPRAAAVLLARVIRDVEARTGPAVDALDRAALDAFSKEAPAGTATDAALARRAQGTSQATPSGLVASVDALLRSPAEVTGVVRLESPSGAGRVLKAIGELSEDELIALDSTGNNNSVRRVSSLVLAGNRQARIRATAAAARTRPGVRGDAAVPADFADGGVPFQGPMAPEFAMNQFLDVVGANLVLNENLANRYRHYGDITDWTKRVAGQMLLLAPVIEQSFQSFYDKNIKMLVAFLIEQPFRRYTTSTIPFFAHNPQQPLANTYHMDPDLHVGRDAIRKTILYHVSMYLGAVIRDPKRFQLAYDALVVDYHGGENTIFFDQETFKKDQLLMLGKYSPSLFSFMVPAGSLAGIDPRTKVPTTHDIRGHATPLRQNQSATGRLAYAHYASMLYYNSKLKLEEIPRPKTVADWHRFVRHPGLMQTVTHQGKQRMFDPISKTYRATQSHDPFGASVGPGSLARRTSSHANAYVVSPEDAQTAIAI